MSGISTTLLLNRGSMTEECLLDVLKLFGELKKTSDGNYDLRVKKELEIDKKRFSINDSFDVEFYPENKNTGYPDDTWRAILTAANRVKGVIDITCSTRNAGTAFLVLTIIEALAEYDEFLVVNGKPSDLILNVLGGEVLKVPSESIFLLKPSVIRYMIDNRICYNVGYN